ncbi:MAG: STAS domain-containing protein [Rhodococcus sp. (in: high G+C Gram-positive bacteria)]
MNKSSADNTTPTLTLDLRCGAGIDSTHTLLVHGDVDLVTAPELERGIRAESSSTPIVLDLTGVEFFSSAGVTAIENVLAESPDAIDFVIAPSHRVRRTLGVLGLTRLVPVVASTTDGLLAG